MDNLRFGLRKEEGGIAGMKRKMDEAVDKGSLGGGGGGGKPWKKWVTKTIALVVAATTWPAVPLAAEEPVDLDASVRTWEKLKEAVELACAAGGVQTITLGNYIRMEEGLTITNAEIHLCTSSKHDKHLYRTASDGIATNPSPLFTVKAGATLRMTSITLSGQLDGLDRATTPSPCGPLLVVEQNAAVYATQCCFCANANTLGSGGGVVNGGTFDCTDCCFIFLASVGDGGAIYNTDSGRCTLKNNTASPPEVFWFPLRSTVGAFAVPPGVFAKCCTLATGQKIYRLGPFTAEGGRGGAIANSGDLIIAGGVSFKETEAMAGGAIYNTGLVVADALSTCPGTPYIALVGIDHYETRARARTDVAPDADDWGGNLLWNAGDCTLGGLGLYEHKGNGESPDIFIHGRHPIKLAGTLTIPSIDNGRTFKIGGCWEENSSEWSTGEVLKAGADEPGTANDFQFFDTNGYSILNPENASIIGDMPLTIGSDGYVHMTGTDKIHQNMGRYTGPQIVVPLAPGKTVSGILTARLFDISCGSKIVDGEGAEVALSVKLHTPQEPDGEEKGSITTSPLASHPKETQSPEGSTQSLLVTVPAGVAPGSYWLVLYEAGEPIGYRHIHLADVAVPQFSDEGVWTAAEGGTQIAPGSDGYYEYDPNTTPVIKFTLSDTSGIQNGLAGGVAALKLTRPKNANPLTDATVTSEGSAATIEYTVTAPGTYIFKAIDYAGNASNPRTFTLEKGDPAPPAEEQPPEEEQDEDEGEQPPEEEPEEDEGEQLPEQTEQPPAQPPYDPGTETPQPPVSRPVNITNNNVVQIINDSASNSGSNAGENTAGSTNSTSNGNSNSSNQDSSNASENSNNAANGGATSAAGGAGTTGGAGTATAEEAAAAAKKKPDKTEFTFYGGKSYSNKTGKITPSKYISKQAFYNAKPGDVLLKARSDSAGESGVSEQELTKEDVIEATKKQEAAIAGVAYQISPAPRAIPNVNFAGTAGASERRSPKRRR
jgi:hypothetical protein